MNEGNRAETRRIRRAERQKKKSAGRNIARLLLVLATIIIAMLLSVAVALAGIMKGPSPAARDVMVTTVLESGNLKFLAGLFLSSEEIEKIISRTSMSKMDEHQDTELVDTEGTAEGNFDENGIEIIEVNGRSYYGTLMVVKDPSKLKVATTYPWSEYGKQLGEIVESADALAGVNGGLYAADKNKGGSPYGVCVSDGEIQLNKPWGWAGLYMIGFDGENKLRIENIEGWSASKFEQFVKDEGIRDAVAFQDELTDANNHFVPLIINGEARELHGAGSGANPRTAIGQRADGAVLLFVTDGRGASGHLGATASDLISVMQKYEAVNAANLDGGSSSSMYYNGEYLMTSVTLYYANASWRLPTAFVVTGGGD